MSLSKHFAVTSLLITIGFNLIACGGNNETNVSKGTAAQEIHLSNGDEPQGLDPHITTGMPEYRIQHAIFEGLIAKDPQTLEPTPAVAASWEVSEDGKLYTFNIRQAAKWSNGDPITAQDFTYSWQRALSPGLGNQYAYSLYQVKNAKAFHKGEIKDFSEVGVKALDNNTLQIELIAPSAYFLQLLDHHSMYPVHKATIEKFGQMDERGTKWTRPGNIVSNGPFVLTEWVPNKVLSISKNPSYWDADNVKLQGAHYYPVAKDTVAEQMFRAEQLHITLTVPIEKVAVYRKDKPHLIYTDPFLGTYFYLFNTTIKPLDDHRVRLALAMSIDRQKIVDKVTKSGQIPAYNLTPPDTMGYTAEAKIEFNIEKAQALLAEAGYPNGENFPKLEMLFNTSEGHRKIAVAIQQMWKQALNIDIGLHNQDWKVYLDSTRTKNYQIARQGWIGDYLDPNTFLDMYITGSGNNRTGWSNARYDELIALAAQTNDQAQRYAYFQEAEKILVEQAPILPLYTYTNTYLKHPDVKGWYSNILDYHPLKYVSLEASASQ